MPQCFRLATKRCESSVIHFNAQCAGCLVLFGCFKSLCAALVGPLKVLHGILHRDAEVFKRGTISSAIWLLLMPLRGFYVCLGALSCKGYAKLEYVATVAASCIDSLSTCAIFWALARGRKMAILPSKRSYNRRTVKLNQSQVGAS
ncbi:hypothetical protein BaOVIS_027250 [Babesia ovis]|uniref:Uncharacterized protein n=1 Tax=Babesia ovis TaxID=5869 RepID=A0A9W5TCT3_BABOV|nr:hypothetical protein BaOVIS_027250 [Babesia ovis]